MSISINELYKSPILYNKAVCRCMVLELEKILELDKNLKFKNRKIIDAAKIMSNFYSELEKSLSD